MGLSRRAVLALVAAGAGAGTWSALARAAGATALERLQQFTRATSSARGEFRQVVVGRDGRRLQESSGTFALARPGRFRWAYTRPYQQLIVADGRKVWVFDADLNQVTVKPVDQALGTTPAAILVGAADLERGFELSELPGADGLAWASATPRSREAGFESIRLGFDAGGLAALELLDNFGQRTQIRLSGIERNQPLPPELFTFTPPKGADVIGE